MGPASIDCSELTFDEELALAGRLSDYLEGRGVALVDGDKIVLDLFGHEVLDQKDVETVVTAFIVGRKDHQYYSIERVGDSMVVHSADPVAGARSRRAMDKAPPNLFKCPFCAFVTPYEDLYNTHRCPMSA